MNTIESARLALDTVTTAEGFHAKLDATVQLNGSAWPVGVALDDEDGGLVVAGLDAATQQIMAAMAPGEKRGLISALQAAVRQDEAQITARLAA